MPESGSGQLENERLPTPEGWQPVGSGSAVIRPNWSKRDIPPRLEQSTAKVRDRLETDDRFLAAFKDRAEELRTLIFSRQPEAITDLLAIASDLAEQHCPPDVPTRACLLFILERCLPPMGIPMSRLNEILGHLEPVELVANTGEEPYDLEIHRGEFGMRFAGARSQDRAAFNTIIKQAQETFGYADNGGGRPTRERVDAGELPKTAAKLHHWLAFAYDEIASLFGWRGQPDSVRERVRNYVRSGERALDDELGKDWRVNPPQELRGKERGS